jgi:hypothetical protein
VQTDIYPRYKHLIEYHERSGHIRVCIEGFQGEADVERYMIALRSTVDMVRARGLPIRVLADVSRAVVRSPPTAAQQKAFNDKLYRDSDRVALIVTSSLLKMQIERNSVTNVQRSFADRVEAEQWLRG